MIVLIILASISINLVLGQNGIIDKAQRANKEVKEKQIREEIHLCVESARTEKLGKIKYDSLIQELNKEFGEGKYEIVPQDESETEYTITINGVSENLTIEKDCLAEIIEPKNYGDDIIYEANGIDNWKVFYNDGKNVFIITSDYIENTKVPEGLGVKKEGKFLISWVGDKNNAEDLDVKIFNKFLVRKYINEKYNTRAVNSMMNAEKWNVFKVDKLADAAIGTPTLEMFCNSWNQKGYGYINYRNDDSGYYVGTDKNPTTIKCDLALDVGYNDKLYFPHKEIVNDECLGYQLASPVATDSGMIFRISKFGNINYRYYSVAAESLRPVVCLNENVIGVWDENSQKWKIE